MIPFSLAGRAANLVAPPAGVRPSRGEPQELAYGRFLAPDGGIDRKVATPGWGYWQPARPWTLPQKIRSAQHTSI